MSFDLLVRGLVILLLAGRYLYWEVTEKKADAAKPKTRTASLRNNAERYSVAFLGLIILLQLLGLHILPFQTNNVITLVGLLFVIVGISCSIKARRDLGVNWAHAAEYQIKKDHELITSGIYTYIRHPIYSCMTLSFLGAELVVGSYLFIVLLLVLPLGSYFQAKKEEKILLSHFGNDYASYKKKSKMFIPYVW
jgi:protein-S-isoprenylcysteine O-methyltransferase Ste14